MERANGVLLHISSLPGKYGIGTLGKSAYDFVDFLSDAGVKVWQVLPLTPTGYGDSPYQSVYSEGLNPYFIDLDILIEKGLLYCDEVCRFNFGEGERVDYEKLFLQRYKVLRIAFDRAKKEIGFNKFIQEGKYAMFGLFMAIKEKFGFVCMDEWPDVYRRRDRRTLDAFYSSYKEDVFFWQWTQYEFLEQWKSLHQYAAERKVLIMGDMPIYVAYDSVDVWIHPEVFLLKDGNPEVVAGVPPDYFSETGQLWGNPVYDWEYLRSSQYKWWNERLLNAFKLFDIVRIDHFRAFDEFYVIENGKSNAKEGKWLPGPGADFFKDKLHLNIVAEDLGMIGESVRDLIAATGYPGMKILEFGFDGDVNGEHKPTNIAENFVVYTGTHDNMPLYAFILELSDGEKERFVSDVISQCEKMKVELADVDPCSLVNAIIELGYASAANLMITPMQDLLCEGACKRMNLPSSLSTDNWSYRVNTEKLTDDLKMRLKKLAEKYLR